ncbi:hypothetical protein BpHYR1_042996 [Brachionus plicatilis]|uniref:Uncharacterized protein n=1 Tax=Brachionus plicatilis TaxID=10195 RepID=A0A3M7SMH6_BRAPC|nr:hypothetical protein BpHYR1_042996 [Brachionus plicatilis]
MYLENATMSDSKLSSYGVFLVKCNRINILEFKFEFFFHLKNLGKQLILGKRKQLKLLLEKRKLFYLLYNIEIFLRLRSFFKRSFKEINSLNKENT